MNGILRGLAVPFVLLGLGAVITATAPSPVSAESWFAGSTFEVSDSVPSGATDPSQCYWTTITAKQLYANPDPPYFQPLTKQYNACVTTGKSFQLAQYYDSDGRQLAAIKPNSDSVFYVLAGHGYHLGTQLGIGTDTLTYRLSGGLISVDNLLGNIERGAPNEFGEVVNYYVKPSAEKRWFGHELDGITRLAPLTSFLLSQNGRYGLAWLDYAGMVKIDFATGEAKVIGYFGGSWYGGSDNPYPFAISSDGKYAFIHGPTIVDMENCGYELTTEILESGTAFDTSRPQCPRQNFYYEVADRIGYNGRASQYRLTGNEKAIEFIYGPAGYTHYPTKYVTMWMGGADRSRLDYLALGDSYSSGEGDTELNPATNKKHYREFTDNGKVFSPPTPEEKCHISPRSYPYLLGASMGLGNPQPSQLTHWQTVACAGATAWDVKEQDSDYYPGQGDRLKDYDHSSLKVTALNEFIPGRQKQIEFVKKYQPKAITLTMGGNDIGFAQKVYQCATPFTIDVTCDWADSKKGYLGLEIKNQYENLEGLYILLRNASPNTKIYALGYPQFINGNPSAQCDTNVAHLNAEERLMIVSSVEYLNNVIEKAAKAAGIFYVDVEDSLTGHRLCDSSSIDKYVTGVTNVAGSNGNERQESFHPNHKAHMVLAQTITGKLDGRNLNEFDTCPLTPSVSDTTCPDPGAKKDNIDSVPYFEDAMPPKDIQYKQMVTDDITKQSSTRISVGAFSFGSDSNVSAKLYSNPIDLGTYAVSGSGALNIEVQIPDSVPAGWHTLELTGQTFSGEPITYEQTVLVKGSDSADVDDDNILDAGDPCLFIPPANQDVDLDGEDDACDPLITEPQEPYRVRVGDATRTYANVPENPRFMYIERNINTGEATGITDDYDPDGDGWAVVGASEGSIPNTNDPAVIIPDNGPAASFVISTSGSTLRPVAYTRTPLNGCVGFTPTSLAKVELGQVRTLKTTYTHVDKCRSTSPDADVDNNGASDNTQSLYMARSGDSGRGEDPTKLYLFRSHAAAEAQLGLSDYSPIGTAASETFELSQQPIQQWNLMSSTQFNTVVTYHKLVILQDSEGSPLPTVIGKKSNGTCYAYQPDNQNTNVIRKDTQPTRKLIKLIELPEGVECE